MKKLVVLSGAGISAESGIKTFRESNGLWENHEVTDVASPEGWERDPHLVLDFYNQRRKQLLECEPNAGHKGIVELEKNFDVHVITQNVDNLHERAGSSKILHLHGELTKVESTKDKNLVYDLDGWELKWGDKCEKGAQLRPHIVWFGEAVPAIEPAIELTRAADILVVVGTSLNVYPAAGLINYVSKRTPIYLIDPGQPLYTPAPNITFINEKASTGVQKLINLLSQ
ncbi:SIR2 family NAD-dependent protein deacylase [Carboxylicivirga sp. N1Y90]|uniref:SIR2 family NAD-dependent protein deacylase n=1 Tax=Carboxylicivirga fragile TaxID=3417571 RepID=UPI003D33A6DE|nr:NAD-dependent deacylase [Marinilabiliaceae bacterium N1Y90]